MLLAYIIIFINNKKIVDFLDNFLYNRGLLSILIYFNRTQREREDIIRAFRLNKALLLIITNIFARKLDIKNVIYIINYNLFNFDYSDIHEYVYRIDRTIYIDNINITISFYNNKNENIAKTLIKLLIKTY